MGTEGSRTLRRWRVLGVDNAGDSRAPSASLGRSFDARFGTGFPVNTAFRALTAASVIGLVELCLLLF